MAFVLKYQVQIEFVGPGAGPMSALTAPSLPGSGGGTGQVLEITSNPAVMPIAAGAGAGGTLTAGDITNLLATMSSDVSAQLNAAATLAKINGWPTGNP
jgi:hypothetical protein